MCYRERRDCISAGHGVVIICAHLFSVDGHQGIFSVPDFKNREILPVELLPGNTDKRFGGMGIVVIIYAFILKFAVWIK